MLLLVIIRRPPGCDTSVRISQGSPASEGAAAGLAAPEEQLQRPEEAGLISRAKKHARTSPLCGAAVWGRCAVSVNFGTIALNGPSISDLRLDPANRHPKVR